MKTLVILSFLLIAEHSWAQRTKQQNNQKTKETAIRPRDARALACINQIQPNEDEQESFFRKEIPETDKGKCLLACYLEARGVMTAGKYNNNGAVKYATRAYPNSLAKSGQVKHILSHCGSIASRESEKCQLAYKLADCTTTLSEKFKL